MIYKTFQNEKLSLLGMGAMRLPVIDGNDAVIDERTAQRMVDEAVSGGVNYFDTAWGYHDGQSELFMGKALKKYPRDSFYLATKFPGYDLSNFGKHEEIFAEQLKKCQVDYFDFYLCHNVCEMNIDAYLNEEKYHTVSFLKQQKAAGKIRHLGFSAHGSYETVKRFLEAYGADMEFCQLQINWLDWEFQNAKAKVELLKEYKIPVWVMEPLRGGKLANLSDAYAQKLRALRPEEEIPAWSFRFLQSIPEVTMVLSGMSNEAQMLDNIKTFAESKPLNAEEQEALLEIAKEMTSQTSVPCTACRYCTTHCPQGLNIPYLLELYNEHTFTKDFAFIAPMALQALPEDKRPSACLGCRSCERVCPQQIKISEILADFASMM